MANAKVKTTFALTLELDEDEAKALVAILRHVGGSPLFSRRKHAAAALDALAKATGWDDGEDTNPTGDLRGSLIFAARV